MATTSTARLQLLRVTPNTGEKVLVQLDLNDNWDKIDLLGARPDKLPAAPVKRNTADAVTSATDSIFDTWTGILKTNHWYEVTSEFRMNTTVAVGTNPNGVASIRLKAGATVANTDTQVVRRGIVNSTTSSYGVRLGHVFDVPADGTYTLGLSVNSGGAGNTVNILASGGTDNTGMDRCFWVKDLGEK